MLREYIPAVKTDKLPKLLSDILEKNPKVEFLWNKTITEFLGKSDTGLEGLRLKDTKSGEESTFECQGAFLAIGHVPNTEIFKDQIDLDNNGYIITAPKNTKTNIEGVFAAGDVQDSIYRQAISAAGSGCMAALDAQHYLEELEFSRS